MSDDDIGMIAELKLKIISLENEKDSLLLTFKKERTLLEGQLSQKENEIIELEEKLAHNNHNDPQIDQQEEVWKLTSQLEEIERQSHQTLQNQNEIIKDLQIKNERLKVESSEKDTKIVFLEAEITKLTIEKKTMKDSYEKSFLEEAKDKTDQIILFKKKLDDLQREKNEINEEINEINLLKKTIIDLNFKYKETFDKYEGEKEEREKIQQKYDQETTVLKQQNHDLKTQNERLPKMNTANLTAKETKRLSLMETGKITLKFDTSLALGTCLEESDEEEKDYNEELKNVKDYYDKQLSEIKLQNIYLKSEKERLENQLELTPNGFNTNQSTNPSLGHNTLSEVEKLKGKIKEKDKENDALIERLILLKNDIAELTFLKESEILKLKNKFMKLTKGSNTLKSSNTIK